MKKKLQKIISMTLCAMMLFMNCGILPTGRYFINSVQADTTEQSDEETAPLIDEETGEPAILGDVQELRNEYATVFERSDGSFLARYYSSPVRYRDENNNLVDIDPSLTAMTAQEKADKAGYDYKTKASPTEVYLPQNLTADAPVRLEFGDYVIKLLPIEEVSLPQAQLSASPAQENGLSPMSLAEGEGGQSEESVPQQELQPNSEVVVTPAVDSAAPAETSLIENLYEEEETRIVSLKYGAFGEQAAPQSRGARTMSLQNTNPVEVEYIPHMNGLKENIILHAPPQSNRFSFSLELSGCYPVLQEDGSVYLLDAETDELAGAIPAPFMEDSSGDKSKNYSDAVYYELAALNAQEGKYVLTVVADSDYLNDSERVYPVIIDPSFDKTEKSEMNDAYVFSGSHANTNYYSPGIKIFRCGYSASIGGLARTYIRFPAIERIETHDLNNKIITSAKLYAKESGNSPPYATMTLYRTTQNFEFSKLTWNTQPTSESFGCGTSTATGSAMHVWDISRVVGYWANKTKPNYGIVLRATDETGNVNNLIDLYGTRTGASIANWPHLDVTYFEPPTVVFYPESGDVNSGRANLTCWFPKFAGCRYFLCIGPKGWTNENDLYKREITNQITQSTVTDWEWTSIGKPGIFDNIANKPGIPDSANTKWSNYPTAEYDIFLRVCNSNGVGPDTNHFIWKPYDATAPNMVSTPTANVTKTGNGRAGISVTFNKPQDEPDYNASGVKGYQLQLFTGANPLTSPKVLENDAVHESTANSLSYTFPSINTNTYAELYAGVAAYDANGNISGYSMTSSISIPNFNDPVGSVSFSPNGVWTNNTEPVLSWSGITDNHGSVNLKWELYQGNTLKKHGSETVTTTAEGNVDLGFNDLADGAYSLRVYASNDNAANTVLLNTFNYYLDRSSPVAKIVSP